MNIDNDLINLLKIQNGYIDEDIIKLMEINKDDYFTFKRNNNWLKINFLSKNNLYKLLLKLENENILQYKNKFKNNSDGMFSNLKILKHLDKVSSIIENDKTNGPITVEFHPSNKCNQRCPFCVYNIYNKTVEDPFFNINLLEKFIIDLKNLNIKALHISGGGEPLLYPKFNEIINLSYDNGLEIGLVTNGSLFNNETIENVISKCLWCRISVDAGSKEIYEMSHGRGSNFEIVIENIKKLCFSKMRSKSNITLGVSFLLTPYNFNDLLKAVLLFRDIEGLNYIQVKPIALNQTERIESGIIFWNRYIFDMLNMINSYETENFKIYTLGHKFFDMVTNEINKLPFEKCYGHSLFPTVSANGDIMVCCLMLDYAIDGKKYGIYDTIDESKSFKEIWENEKRFKVGNGIDVKLCPSNCKLSESNKFFETLKNLDKIKHYNFIN